MYDLLQSLTLNGPAWAWKNMYQHAHDGQSVWKQLINCYEGEPEKTCDKQECMIQLVKLITLDQGKISASACMLLYTPKPP